MCPSFGRVFSFSPGIHSSRSLYHNSLYQSSSESARKYFVTNHTSHPHYFYHEEYTLWWKLWARPIIHRLQLIGWAVFLLMCWWQLKLKTPVTFQSPCCDLIVSSFVGGQCAAFETVSQSAQSKLKVSVWEYLNVNYRGSNIYSIRFICFIVSSGHRGMVSVL